VSRRTSGSTTNGSGGGRPRPPARDLHRRRLARVGEELAAQHLRGRGFTLLERNARTRGGEIDLIAYDGHLLAFVEVKTRQARGAAAAGKNGAEGAGGAACKNGAEGAGAPLSGLRPRQRARIRRLAAAWLCEPGRTVPWAHELRFDAIGVLIDARGGLLRLEHLEAAF
jgi:putative endonuclease